MNFKLLSAILVLSVFVASCGDDDASSSLNYPVLATFSAVAEQGNMEIFVKSGGNVTELTADQTSADENEVFDDLSDGLTTVSYEFTSETEVTIYDSDPIFGDTSMASVVLRTDEFDIQQTLGSLTLTVTCLGDPTDFRIPSSAYYVDSPSGFSYSAVGLAIETLDDLKASLEEGDTLAYIPYNANFKQ